MNLEMELDKYLKIKTSGRDDSKSNFINFPYEATPYSVLQMLVNSGYITKKDRIIDFGCGKGRVDFFLAYYAKAKMIGIEYDERLYNSAMENKKNAISSNRVNFIMSCASQYNISDDITGAYFFNPFSVTILKTVVDNILESKKRNNRDIKLFFYYPSKQYKDYLESIKEIKNIDNIDCRHLFNNNDEKEYIAVYLI